MMYNEDESGSNRKDTLSAALALTLRG